MKKSAFVLMPFAQELADVYKFLIVEGLEQSGYVVKRADDIKSQSNILNDIISAIVSSDLIVADLTGSNPNVYYELGVAHALNKNVILLTQDIDELPFDLRSYRVVSYSVHFSKMNQAKEELSQLAFEAFNGKLPFSNPVKDFSGIATLALLNRSDGSSFIDEYESEDGLLDYRLRLENGFEILGEIVTQVGSRLQDEVTPEILKAGEKLNSGKCTTKQQHEIVAGLASHLQEYGAFVKPNNDRYRDLLKDVESSLDYLLGGNVEFDEVAEEQLAEFIDVLSGIRISASEGRDSFSGLIDVMDSLPRIEKSFNRAKLFMSTELKDFLSNIDQTISVISRAVVLGKILLDEKGSDLNL
ncbi:nucleoside 2-deoxyribosyltransferase [Aeromonas caviae]|uniref:nucleoside 2-deoxyribosyltransferase n=1 Tax=Aeromonas caviae TaxID=648 RepID=UPI002B48CF46|nr:nucleoside 2-deoxyribosyltransferase [Aeromonas caviae]